MIKPSTKKQTQTPSGLKVRTLSSRGKCTHAEKTDFIAEEKAIAMVYNGISHAVMMATPLHLEDFATGFSLTEGIIDEPGQIRNINITEATLDEDQENCIGYEVHIEIASSSFMKLKQRRRQLNGRTGCGICGLESLQAVMPEIKQLPTKLMPSFEAIENSVVQMKERQNLQSQCGAVHAAALSDFEGNILELREDVGRHNALDKLLGHIACQQTRKNQNNFVLISSRASFEMVAKSATQSIATLVAVSAPTDLAIELAKKANMNLIGFVKSGRQLIYNTSSNSQE